MTQISVVRGSLLDQKVEAIVNAANTSMRGGGGIDGAIHRVAGPGLLEELKRLAPYGTNTTEVVVTKGYGTGFKYILHTPGPVWGGGGIGEEELLLKTYVNAAKKAVELGVESVGFCSISTGVYRFPLKKAAPIALEGVRSVVDGSNIEEVVFAMFEEAEYGVFSHAWAEISTR